MVDPLVQRVDRASLRVRVQVQRVVRRERVELIVQVPDDLRALVGDDRGGFLVPQDGDGEARPGRPDAIVQVAHESHGGAVDGISLVVTAAEAPAPRGRRKRLARVRERPAGVRVVRVRRARLLPRGVHGGPRDDVAEALQADGGHHAARPRARERDVDVVPTRLGRERSVLLDAVAEDGVLAHERAGRAHVRHRGVAGGGHLIEPRAGGRHRDERARAIRRGGDARAAERRERAALGGGDGAGASAEKRGGRSRGETREHVTVPRASGSAKRRRFATTFRSFRSRS